ncbi:hypothetical protein [Clostridium estertheticum]|uniref:hypothetical protein n=1 Tax=Clostridium estertheticum TaxID=238834 RepID=UPI001CF5396A|nr:hypothetical protein [Clostridium estertheticum]MCB2347880.1 hypothetical protein [Clostridium estertheticum]
MKIPYKIMTTAAIAVALSSIQMISAQAAVGDFYNQTTQTKYTKAALAASATLADGLNDQMTAGNVILKEYNTGKYIDYAKANTSFLGDIADDVDASTATLSAIAAGKTDATTAVLEAYKDSSVTTALSVSSVSAINAKQIKVTFSEAVKESTVISNTTLGTMTGAVSVANIGTANGVGTPTATLSEDGKELTITSSTSFFKGSYSVLVSDAVISKADTSKAITPYSQILTVKDEVKPAVKSIVSSTNGTKATTATIKFTEPVTTVTVKIDGVVVAGSLATDGLSYSATGLNLDSSKTHSVEVIGLTDYALNTVDTYTQSFTVTTDAVAPTVNVSAKADNQILLAFNKDMDASTVIAANLVVYGEDLTPIIPTSITSAVVDDVQNFVITLPSSIYTAKDSANLTLAFKADLIKDSLGNKLAPKSTNVLLAKNIVAPAITDVTYQKNTLGVVTGLVVKTDKELKTGTILTSGIKVIDKDGVDVSTNFLAATSTAVAPGDKEVTLPLNILINAIKSGEYTVMLPADLITDASVGAKKTAAKNVVVNFGSAAATEFKLADGTGADYAVSSSSNVVTVKYRTAVKGGAVAGSATDLSNYTLYGSTLPVGTTITLNTAKDTAIITLPTSAIAKDDVAAVFTVRNVQDANGTVVTPYTKAVTVADNTAPVLLSAKVLDNKTIILTYSEDMTTLSAATVGDEFQVKQDAITLGLADAELTASNVAGYNNQVKLTVNKTVGSTTAANLGTVTPSKVNTTGVVSGTYTGTANKNYVATVKTLDPVTSEATVVTVDGTDITESVAGNHTFVLANGVTIVVSKDTGTLAANDTFSFTATAATTATPVTIDLTKDLTIKALAPASGVDIKDASGIHNAQKASDSVIAITK